MPRYTVYRLQGRDGYGIYSWVNYRPVCINSFTHEVSRHPTPTYDPGIVSQRDQYYHLIEKYPDTHRYCFTSLKQVRQWFTYDIMRLAYDEDGAKVHKIEFRGILLEGRTQAILFPEGDYIKDEELSFDSLGYSFYYMNNHFEGGNNER